MHSLKLLFSLVLVGFVAGCAARAPRFDTTTHIDPYTGLRTDLLSENLLEGPEPPRELIWLNASRVFKNRKDYDYYLELHYEARSETGVLDIGPGATLVLVADGHPMQFFGTGSLNRRRHENGLVSEDAIYPATGRQLQKIAESHAVTVRVIGRNGEVVRDFAPENFARFQSFVTDYVPFEE
jgi:hypothetical protein